MKYAMIASGVLALVITGCSSNNDDNGGTNVGMDNVNHRTADVNDVRNVRNDIAVPNTRPIANDTKNHTANGLKIADVISKEVDKLKEVKRSTVFLSDHSAYVAAELADSADNKLTKTIKNKISDRVKETDNTVDKVYVSTNPDFIDRMNGYVNDVKGGKPISGLADEFGETVNRIFPNGQ